MIGPEAYRDPEGAGAGRQAVPSLIEAKTRMGEVQLTVSDLARSIDYYERVIGLEVREHAGEQATLGAIDGGENLLVLTEVAGARPDPRATGLYHFALLLPEREDLGAWLAHAVRERISLEGASDHFVSEAVYLRDPDNHGIEIYCDRPWSLWEGHVAATMTTDPLNIEGLLALVEDEPPKYDGMPSGTVMGHVHLQVSDIAASITFYRDVLGFGLMAEMMGSAAFFGAGGYHHHIGANTWHSAGRAPAGESAAALRHFTVLLPDDRAMSALHARLQANGIAASERDGALLVRDPSGNAMLLAVDGSLPAI